MHTKLATTADLDNMVKLSYEKRRSYELAQPIFWRYAGPAGDKVQRQWFEELMQKNDYILMVCEENDKILGFVIGRIIKAPDVYDPGGLTLMIDDFCIDKDQSWDVVGKSLIDKIKILGSKKGSTQLLVISGAHDEAKNKFLSKINLTTASYWYTGSIF